MNVRIKIIQFLKIHPNILDYFWRISRVLLSGVGHIVRIKPKRVIFSSMGGRKYDDSPRTIYEEMISMDEFKGWEFYWAFANPSDFAIPVGKKIRIDSIRFFWILLSSHIWVSNSGMDRGIRIKKKNIIKVETWHGTALKKFGGEENTGSMRIKKDMNRKRPLDVSTIRCCQSIVDRETRARVEHSSLDCYLLSGLPRNDYLFKYTDEDKKKIRFNLKIPETKSVILYTPTYREYMLNNKNETFLKIPIDMPKWKKILGKDYVLLIRAHYAVIKELGIEEDDFIKDVSNYGVLSDLYYIADIMISDYSSTFVDYSILDRPMFCFPYDYDEYNEKRGINLQIFKSLPCDPVFNEDDLLKQIKEMDYKKMSEKTKIFHKKFACYDDGNSAKKVTDELIRRINV